jgi:hypothetical protein
MALAYKSTAEIVKNHNKYSIFQTYLTHGIALAKIFMLCKKCIFLYS